MCCSDLLDLLRDDYRVLFLDLGRGVGPVVEGTAVQVRVAVRAAEHVSASAVEACEHTRIAV